MCWLTQCVVPTIGIVRPMGDVHTIDLVHKIGALSRKLLVKICKGLQECCLHHVPCSCIVWITGHTPPPLDHLHLINLYPLNPIIPVNLLNVPTTP